MWRSLEWCLYQRRGSLFEQSEIDISNLCWKFEYSNKIVKIMWKGKWNEIQPFGRHENVDLIKTWICFAHAGASIIIYDIAGILRIPRINFESFWMAPWLMIQIWILKFLLDTKTAFSLSIHHSSFINSDTNNKVSLSNSSKIDSTNLHCIPKNYTIKFLTIYYNFLPSYTWQHRLSFNGQFKFEVTNLVDEWRKLSELEEVEMPGFTADHQNRLIFYQNFRTAIVKVKLNFIHAFWSKH